MTYLLTQQSPRPEGGGGFAPALGGGSGAKRDAGIPQSNPNQCSFSGSNR